MSATARRDDEAAGAAQSRPDEEDEAARLRSAYARRGPVEARLATNRGQAAIVAERDWAVLTALTRIRRPVREILDLGCGDGTNLAWLARRAGIERAVGVDLLPERIARARAAWPTLEFQVADGAQLAFPAASFDLVLAMTVFSSVPIGARDGLLRELARVLRPGGGFIWYDMRRSSPTNPDVHPFGTHDLGIALDGWTVSTTRVTVAPPIGRRLGPATRPLYQILAHLPLLLTHEVGLAVRPGPEARPPDA